MKRILVIDESEVVRETLALILGREFAVVKRPLGSREFPVADTREEVDLLIFGVTPQLGSETAGLLRFAAQLPFAVLFLVDSKSIARTIENKAEVACLTKPFNPYELHEKVGQLLARRANVPATSRLTREHAPTDFSPYLDFPYLSRSAATLVRRFAAARLPLLISGEIGAGQERVLAGICAIDKIPGLRLSINATELNEEYLEQKSLRLSLQGNFNTLPTTLVIENLDKISPASQSLLVSFLEQADGKLGSIRYLTTASAELLDRVYRGEFLEALYYKLATLTLKLAPLRERAAEIPVLAEWFARRYAQTLNLNSPALSPEAKRRLSQYLWFGNVNEMETVIARTLAFHRKPHIDGADLIFDFSGDPQIGATEDFAGLAPVEAGGDFNAGEPKFEVYSGSPSSYGSTNGQAKLADLNVVIHELAHELKNPMVTIKTFAQLLGERYQDENFRTRFQEVVGNDIERMDDLLEVLIEFADFAKPRSSKVALSEKLRTVLREIQGESAKRQTRFEWKANLGADEIQTDESQLGYILKNVLLVALSEARMGSEIEIDVSKPATLAIRYLRESARVAAISHYLDEQGSRANVSILPLRVLLAKHLLERNGGQFAVEPSDEEKETLRLEFPLAEHRNEN
ncbi:MAG: histidine kinase dimerization/phospho-acceptor domain-containing protein [Candidatus Binatia bacterium]